MQFFRAYRHNGRGILCRLKINQKNGKILSAPLGANFYDRKKILSGKNSLDLWAKKSHLFRIKAF